MNNAINILNEVKNHHNLTNQFENDLVLNKWSRLSNMCKHPVKDPSEHIVVIKNGKADNNDLSANAPANAPALSQNHIGNAYNTGGNGRVVGTLAPVNATANAPATGENHKDNHHHVPVNNGVVGNKSGGNRVTNGNDRLRRLLGQPEPPVKKGVSFYSNSTDETGQTGQTLTI